MDGELPGVEQLAVTEHLKCCESCRDEYESLLFTKRLLSGLKVKEPVTTLENRIQRSIAAEAHRPQPESRTQNWWSKVVVWWHVMAYDQQLRFSAVFAASSVGLAILVITPTILHKPEDAGLTGAPTIASDATAPSQDYQAYQPAVNVQYRRILPSVHDPAENPPPANGAPVLVPVSSDEVGVRGR
jgi:predicted anti-sigma-YlaC factor YlaD